MQMGTHKNIMYIWTEKAVEEQEAAEALGEETAEEGELEGMEAMGLILMGMKGMQRDRRALAISS